jgi:chromosomal replication initiator protein
LCPEKRLLYVSAREFQAQYTDSVRQNTTNVFINSYQSADMLIVDDIQEWINAPKTLETFFHIFNHLVSCGRQIILVCDRPPLNLYGMNERMLTRFGCGLVAELEKPDVQLCIDILKAKCRNNGLEIPDDITEFVAKSANGNVYVLEGMLNSLKAYSLIDNSTIDMNLAERVTACCTCV